jgi:two-component sensor histidine kinase
MDDEAIIFKWKEIGGPRIDLPKREGFGGQLTAVCIKALSGSIRQDFAPDGFACWIRFKAGGQKSHP